MRRLENAAAAAYPNRSDRQAAHRVAADALQLEDAVELAAADRLSRELASNGHVVWRGCVQTKVAAIALSVTEDCLRQWRKDGVGPPVEPTGSRDAWYSINEISRWREGRADRRRAILAGDVSAVDEAQ